MKNDFDSIRRMMFLITVISSKDLKTNTDMVCAFCGKDHNIRGLNGSVNEIEGIDYVFETDSTDE
jgi:hypothetical protein